MNLRTHSITAEGRFANLLGKRRVDAGLCDRPLLETADWVVAPTLGAIVSNWLIVVPRLAALNYKVWQQATGQDPFAIVAQVGEHLGLSAEKLLWFEHGPRDMGTVVGCGVDYAHLHILFDSTITFAALMDRARASAPLSWRPCASELAYAHLTGDQSYLVVGNGDQAEVTENVDVAGSQFLRRVAGATAGISDDWDYKRHPHHENIALTVAAFQARAHGAARGG